MSPLVYGQNNLKIDVTVGKENSMPGENSTNVADAYFKQGITQTMVFQNFQLGVESFSKSIELNPDNPLTYYNRGYAYMKLNKFDKAIEDLDKSIIMDPENKRAYLNLGKCYAIKGDHNLAVSEYKRCLEYDEDYASAYYNMGLSYNHLKQFENALKAYDQSIKLDPDRSTYYFNRGIVKQELRKLSSALDDFHMAAKLDNKDAEVHFAIGFTYLNLGENAKAKLAFQDAIESDSTYWDAYFNRGLISMQELDFTTALNDIEIYCSNNNSDPLGFFYKGKAEMELENYYSAMDDFKRSVELDPDFNWANYYLGYIMINSFGKFEGCDYLRVAAAGGIKEAQNTIDIACKSD